MNIIKTISFHVMILIAFGLFETHSLPAQYSSKYRMTKSTVSQGGGQAASSVYLLENSIGQPSPIGNMANAQYLWQAGFVLPEPLNSGSDAILVTLRANTSTLPDTLQPYHVLQIRGDLNGKTGPVLPDGRSISRDEQSGLFFSNIGGDYWEASFQMLPGDSLRYKFWAGFDVYQSAYGDGLEGDIQSGDGFAGSERSLIPGNRDTTLQLQFFNGTGTIQSQYWSPFSESTENIAVRFRVYMHTYEGVKDGYLPLDGSMTVGVRGNDLNGQGPLTYAQANITLERELSDADLAGYHLYSGTLLYDRSLSGQIQQFKYVNEPDRWEEGNLTGDRSFTIPEQDTTLLWQSYGNTRRFGGSIRSIPGIVEAEDYWQMHGIQLDAVSNDDGDFYAGWMDAGDWVDYRLIAVGAGEYDVSIHAALDDGMSAGQGQFMREDSVLTTFEIPVTGGWQTWEPCHCTINLIEGEQILRLYVNHGPWNYNSLQFNRNETGVSENSIQHPSENRLEANYPNPFNPSTHIQYSLTHNGPVSLTIFNMKGQCIRKLVDAYQAAGQYSIEWDGMNDAGISIGSGIYLCVFRTKDFIRVHKMISIK